MKKILLAAATVGMLAIGAPPAFAHDTVVGGCGFSSVAPDDNNTTYTGEIDLQAVVHNGTGPAQATFLCELEVNGNVEGELTGSTNAAGIAIAAEPFSYTAQEGDTVQMCTTVTYADGHTERTCGDATEFEVPPQVVQDLIIQLTSIPDPTLCPILAQHPGDYGLFRIDAQGDVYFVDPIGKFWDCMPYDPPVA